MSHPQENSQPTPHRFVFKKWVGIAFLILFGVVKFAYNIGWMNIDWIKSEGDEVFRPECAIKCAERFRGSLLFIE
jgi:hypothetical protein